MKDYLSADTDCMCFALKASVLYIQRPHLVKAPAARLRRD